MPSEDFRFQEGPELVVDKTEDNVIDKTVISATNLEPVKVTAYADPQALVGKVLDKYEIEALIGNGGMGCVYRARHTVLNRHVAVKVLHKHLISHQSVADRFKMEAQAAHALRHPNLASVTDFGFGENGEFYLVMDFIEGQTLQDRLNKG